MTNTQIWVFLIAYAAVLVALCLLFGIPMYRRAKRTEVYQPRRPLFRLGVWLAVVWFVVGVAHVALPRPWCGFVRMAGMPVMLTTWPAHQAWLVLSGHGAGANVLPELDLRWVLVLAANCLALWLPLLSIRFRSVPIRVVLIVQGVLVVALLVTFWSYGNG